MTIIKHYITPNGKIPFQQWFRKIKDPVVKKRINSRLEMIKLNSQYGDCKNLGNGVCELRFRFGSGYRIYFAKEEEKLILLLCAGDKSTQTKDIEKAKQYWTDYKRKKQSGL